VRIPKTVLGAAVLLLAGACGSSVDGQPTGGSTSAEASTTSKQATPSSSSTGDLTGFTPSAGNQDPSKKIPDIEIKTYPIGQHIQTPQRVAYDQSPPFGGTHDAVWAACGGVVYTKAVRTEHMVHTLEHGAVWIAYNPDQVQGDAVAALAKKVTGRPYTVMSPYPGLDKPVSLQSWGHRLKLADAADPRIDQFIKSLRQNQYTYPEPGATCDSPQFDQDNPPPFDPSPPPADAAPVGS
jgi:hypothetical protein